MLFVNGSPVEKTRAARGRRRGVGLTLVFKGFSSRAQTRRDAAYLTLAHAQRAYRKRCQPPRSKRAGPEIYTAFLLAAFLECPKRGTHNPRSDLRGLAPSTATPSPPRPGSWHASPAGRRSRALHRGRPAASSGRAESTDLNGRLVVVNMTSRYCGHTHRSGARSRSHA